jgi:hypothetical protein
MELLRSLPARLGRAERRNDTEDLLGLPDRLLMALTLGFPGGGEHQRHFRRPDGLSVEYRVFAIWEVNPSTNLGRLGSTARSAA